MLPRIGYLIQKKEAWVMNLISGPSVNTSPCTLLGVPLRPLIHRQERVDTHLLT